MTEINNVVSKLCSDGSVWPVDHSTTLGELVNLVHYKIRTEGDMANKHKAQLNTTTVTTAVVDLGKQLLLYAKDSDLTGVQTMLARGAPFTSDWLGMSALHFAAMNNQYEICDVLIKGGMNKDIKTKVDRTPLHFAAYYGHERIVEMLLSRKCAVNPKDMLRMTPLHWAIERKHKNIARLLLKYHADVNVVTKFNKTPIGIAVLTEQADILAELQVAKAEQAKKKFNEEQEKEISSAVGTILAETADIAQGASDYMESEMGQIERTAAESSVTDRNAINLLKSHGIAMMQDDDEHASKELLSTALQNGRQLVLSEGGKMLLNETRQLRPIKNITSNENHRKDIGNFSMPEAAPRQKTAHQTNVDQQKNNVRIVSYKEFQHMFYNNANGKVVEKPTMSSMSNIRIVRQQNDTAAINLSNTTSGRSSQQALSQQQHRQMKITPIKSNTTATTISSNTAKTTTSAKNSTIITHDGKDLSDFIEILPGTDDDDYCGDENDANVDVKQNISNQLSTVNDGGSFHRTPPVCFIPAVSSKMEASNPQTTTTTGTATVREINAIKRPHSHLTPPHQSQSSIAKIPATNATKPNVMPLLRPQDICHELYKMRKQNEDLLRRVDTLEKEKEDMRQRLDRLEELLLVEPVNDTSYEESGSAAGLDN